MINIHEGEGIGVAHFGLFPALVLTLEHSCTGKDIWGSFCLSTCLYNCQFGL